MAELESFHDNNWNKIIRAPSDARVHETKFAKAELFLSKWEVQICR